MGGSVPAPPAGTILPAGHILTDGVGGGIESITTDGTLLFAHQSAGGLFGGRERVRALQINDDGGSFTLTTLWDVGPGFTFGSPARIRGIAQHGGFVFGADNGNGGAGSVFAWDIGLLNINAADPNGLINLTAFDPSVGGTRMNALDASDPAAGWGVDADDDYLYAVSDSGFLHVWDLDLLSATPTATNEQEFDVAALLFAEGAAESTDVALLGIAVKDVSPTEKFLFVSYESRGEGQQRRVAGLTFDWGAPVPLAFTQGEVLAADTAESSSSPEPASAALVLLSATALLGRRRGGRAKI